MSGEKRRVSKKTANTAKRVVKKTAKKHPKLIIAIAVVLVVAIIGLIVGAYFYTDGDFSRLPYLLGIKTEPSEPPAYLGADGQLAVYCVNVGQGNSALIAFPDGKFMLIDAGNTATDAIDGAAAKQNLFATIDGASLDGEIDYLIATHPDADHTNLLDDVLTSYQVNMVMYNDSQDKSQTYQKFVNLAADEPNCQVVKIGEYGFESGGNEYEITGSYNSYSYTVTVYAAGYKTFNNKANDMSPIVVLKYGGFEGIIYGDGTTDTEEWWINYLKTTDNISEYDIDFLYVAHHGSSSSSGAKFLNFVKAEYAVISCGLGNSYGHPTEAVMTRLDSFGVATFRTDKHGTTAVVVDPDGGFGFVPENYDAPVENNSVNRSDLIIPN